MAKKKKMAPHPSGLKIREMGPAKFTFIDDPPPPVCKHVWRYEAEFQDVRAANELIGVLMDDIQLVQVKHWRFCKLCDKREIAAHVIFNPKDLRFTVKVI